MGTTHLLQEPALYFSQDCTHAKCDLILVLLLEGNTKTEEANQPAES